MMITPLAGTAATVITSLAPTLIDSTSGQRHRRREAKDAFQREIALLIVEHGLQNSPQLITIAARVPAAIHHAHVNRIIGHRANALRRAETAQHRLDQEAQEPGGMTGKQLSKARHRVAKYRANAAGYQAQLDALLAALPNEPQTPTS